MKKLILLILLGTLLTACGKSVVSKQTPVDVEVVEGQKISSVNEGAVEFSLELFKEINEVDSDKNIFISPYSVMNALALTLNGAEGETYEEISDAMGLDDLPLDEINNGLANLNSEFVTVNDPNEVKIANSIWVRDGVELNQEYRENVMKYFGAEATNIDFAHKDAPKYVNEWIEDNTEGLIKDMISQFRGDELALLINTIYFNAKWELEFNESNTEEKLFSSYDGSETTVDMMSQFYSWGLPYYNTDEYEVVSVPYMGNEYSMEIILPYEGVDVNDVIETLDKDEWDMINESFENYQIYLELPKFELEYGVRSIVNELRALGMDKAFGNADFSSMFVSHNGYIDDVLHKAVVDVNEQGTEAAAATVVVMVESAPPEMPKVDFLVNRPFVFVISDNEDNILFIGKKLN